MPQGNGDVGPTGQLVRGLRFRVAALLALSLLPIGLVTIVQTTQLAEEVRDRSQLTLLSLTDQAAADNRRLLERAIGSSEALAAFLLNVRDDPEACSAFLRDYMERSERISFVGFLPRNGIMTCSSAPGMLDFSADPSLAERMENPRSRVSVIENPAVSNETVLSVLVPVEDGDVFAGYVALSVPYRLAETDLDIPGVAGLLSLVTFNRDGEILTTRQNRGFDGPLLPRDIDLSDLAKDRRWTFNDRDQNGDGRTFVVISVLPGQVFALATWPEESRAAHLGGVAIPPFVLPVLMVLASISVAYLAIDRLVARPVSDLRASMRQFASHRILPTSRRRRALSSELEELDQGFVDLAMDLSNDEAKMEDVLREKNVLLKEIHHRVKNNLQLISSIMNMQIRSAEQPETVNVLRRLQERVLGLATVHRNLYQAENLSRTDAGVLLAELFQQLVNVGTDAGLVLDYQPDFESIILFPDQALPLSLLASELGTNAVKNAKPGPDGRTFLRASFKSIRPGVVQFTCENSTSGDADAMAMEGLGSRLIRAFASQLGGKLEKDNLGSAFRVTLTFEVESFSEIPADY